MIKDLIINYNKGALDYDNIELVCIDAGAGGQLNPWLPYIVIYSKKTH